MTTKTLDEKRAALMGSITCPKAIQASGAKDGHVAVEFLPAERMTRTFKSHEKSMLKNLGCVESNPQTQGLQ